MRKTFIRYLFFIVAGIIMFGCKKNTTNPIPTPPPIIPPGMSAKINNVLWTATIYGAWDTTVGFNIRGIDSMGTSFEIYIDDSVYAHKPGSFKFGGLPAMNTLDYYGINIFARSDSGTLTITQISTHNVQGTFNIATYDGGGRTRMSGNYFITDGQFNIKLN